MDFEKIFESEERKHVKAHFENMIDMAKADGVINEEEMKHLSKMAHRFNITEEEFDKILGRENEYPFNPPIAKEERYLRFVNLVRLIIADDVIDPFEMKTLERFAAGLGFRDEDFENISDGVIGALSEGYSADETVDMIDGFKKAE